MMIMILVVLIMLLYSHLLKDDFSDDKVSVKLRELADRCHMLTPVDVVGHLKISLTLAQEFLLVSYQPKIDHWHPTLGRAMYCGEGKRDMGRGFAAWCYLR